MSIQPRISARRPIKVTLDSGTYSWCACGWTNTEPLCDGSHIGKGFCPTTFEIKDQQTVVLCQCKATQNPPYCDGSHRNLPEPVSDIGEI